MQVLSGATLLVAFLNVIWLASAFKLPPLQRHGSPGRLAPRRDTKAAAATSTGLHALDNAGIDALQSSSTLMGELPDTIDLPGAAAVPSTAAPDLPSIQDLKSAAPSFTVPDLPSIQDLKSAAPSFTVPDLPSVGDLKLPTLPLSSIEEKLAVLSTANDRFVAGVGELIRSAQGYSMPSTEDVIRAVNWDENGHWYITASVLVTITIVGSEQSSTQFKKAQLEECLESEREQLAGKVSELSETTSTVSKELTKLKKEMASLREELKAQKAAGEKLKSENADLKSQLKEKDRNEKDLKNHIKQLEAQISGEEALQKQIDDLTAKLSAGAEVATPEASAPEPKEREPAPGKGNPAAAKAPKAPPEAETKAAPKPEELIGTFFASVEEPIELVTTPSPLPEEAVEKPKSPRARSKTAGTSRAKSPKTAAKATKTIANGDDWASLSPSALKRKTVKELSAYLESKGKPTTSEDGKVLKKAILLDTVMSL